MLLLTQLQDNKEIDFSSRLDVMSNSCFCCNYYRKKSLGFHFHRHLILLSIINLLIFMYSFSFILYSSVLYFMLLCTRRSDLSDQSMSVRKLIQVTASTLYLIALYITRDLYLDHRHSRKYQTQRSIPHTLTIKTHKTKPIHVWPLLNLVLQTNNWICDFITTKRATKKKKKKQKKFALLRSRGKNQLIVGLFIYLLLFF